MAQTTLEKQCSDLNIDLLEICLDYDDSPEKAALSYFESLGFIGSYIEGFTILTVLKALMLDKLTELNHFKNRNDACTRYLEAQLTILKENQQEIIQTIPNVNSRHFNKNLVEIVEQVYIREAYPELSLDCCRALYNAIESETFINLAKTFCEDPYKYRKGWPDLTIVREKEVFFVEIKTKDKLLQSQIETIEKFNGVLPYEFSVLRITKGKTNHY